MRTIFGSQCWSIFLFTPAGIVYERYKFHFFRSFFQTLPFHGFLCWKFLHLIVRVLLQALSRRATLHETIRDYKQAASDLQRLISLLKKQSQEKVRQSGTPDKPIDSTVKELTKAHRHLHSVEEKAKKGTSLDHYLILYVFLFSVSYDFFFISMALDFYYDSW